MDTINNFANSASKAIWGDQPNKETAEAAKTGEEPVSGTTGNVTAGEPYDAGNLDSTNTEKTVPTVNTSDTPAEVLDSTHIIPLKPAEEKTAEEEKAEDMGTSTSKPATSETITAVTVPKEGDGSHTAATSSSTPAPLAGQAETSSAGKESATATKDEPSLAAQAPTEHESGPAADPAPIDTPRKSTTTTSTNGSGSNEKSPGKLEKVKEKAKEGIQKMKSKLSKDKSSDKSSS